MISTSDQIVIRLFLGTRREVWKIKRGRGRQESGLRKKH